MPQSTDDANIGLAAKSARSRHEEVLDAGLRIFASKGYRAATIDDIASELGFTSAALYYYIKGKQDLLRQSVNRPVDTLIKTATDYENFEGTNTEKLASLIENHIRLMMVHKDWFKVRRRDQVFLPEEDIKELRKRDQQYRQIFYQVIVDGNLSGEFEVENPVVCALAILGSLNWTVHWLNPEGDLDPPAVAKEISTTFLRGMKKTHHS